MLIFLVKMRHLVGACDFVVSRVIANTGIPHINASTSSSSINFEARTSRYCMVVHLKEEDEDKWRRTSTTGMKTTITFFQ